MTILQTHVFPSKWYTKKNTENSSWKINFLKKKKKTLLKSDYTQRFYFPYIQRAEHTSGATLSGGKKKFSQHVFSNFI